MAPVQIPLWAFGEASARYTMVPLFTRDRSTSGAKAIARSHVCPIGVTKTVGAFGSSSIDLDGAAGDCCLQPQLRGEFLPPGSHTEILSSHMELPEGDEVVLFNDQLGSVWGISFSRRLKNLTTSAGASSGRQILTAGSSTNKKNAWSCTLSIKWASGEKIFRLLLPQSAPSTLGFST